MRLRIQQYLVNKSSYLLKSLRTPETFTGSILAIPVSFLAGLSTAAFRYILERLRASESFTGLILAIIVGLLAGLSAVAFRELTQGFQWIFFHRGSIAFDFLGDYYVIILPVLGVLIFGPLVYFLAREAKGEGPSEVMEAVVVGNGRIRSRVAAVKTLAASICIGSGGSVGPEGPIVHICSSIGSTIGQWLRLPDSWIKTLVLCGAAGGISAIFNAPIAGIFFALEAIQRRFMAGNLAVLVISSVTADFVAHQFLGGSPVFTIPTYSMTSYWEILAYAMLGIITAFAAVGFIRFFYKTDDLFSSFKVPWYLKLVLGGVIVGFIGYYYPDIFGEGYGESYIVGGEGGVDGALIGEIALGTLIALMLLKMVATSITLGSGGSGGIFAPSLFIGSMLGGAFGIIVHWLFPGITSPLVAEYSGAYALVGMGAFFAVTTRGPITAIILLFELTRNYSLILPLMIAIVFASIIARGFTRESMYTLRLVHRGIDIHRREAADVLRTITVRSAMTRGFPTVLPSMPVSDLMNEMHWSGHHGFPIVDEGGEFCGVVALGDVEAALSQKECDLTAIDVATKSPIVAYPDQSVHDALAQFGGRDVGRIPVVDRNNPKKLLGVLRRHDIVRAYTQAVGCQSVNNNGL